MFGLILEIRLVFLNSTMVTGTYWSESAMHQSVCVCTVHMWLSFTCFFVSLLVWPDDGAEAGEDQCTQSAGSFLWSAVIVQGVLAQHKPVTTLLNPCSSHLAEQPPFRKETKNHVI